MKAGAIFFGTMSFCWLKLVLGLVDILIGAILFAIMMGIALLTASGEIGTVMFIIWLGVWGFIHWMIQHYVGYLLKAGHVAAIAQTFKDGAIPVNPVAIGKDMVKERFVTTNVYFIVDRLVAGAVKQLQKAFGKVLGLFSKLPGSGMIQIVQNVANMFIDISLGYIDECCLGYTFYHKEQNVYKSAADGVVVYAQNWKPLLKDSAKTTFIVLLTILVVTLLSFLLIGGLFKIMGWNMIVAVIMSLILAVTVKYAFLDSWIMVKMMSSYFNAASTTVITYDLYGKLSNMSGKFKELLRKGGETPETATVNTFRGSTIPRQEYSAPQTRFCPQCGTSNKNGVNFCSACGTKMN